MRCWTNITIIGKAVARNCGDADRASDVRKLHAIGRDHVWAYYLRNMVRPAVISRGTRRCHRRQSALANLQP